MESLGRYLRQEREIRQLSLEEIAQTTRIPLRQLQRLEEGNHDDLPGDVFVRGFLRSYANSIGLDPLSTLERYEEERHAVRRPRAEEARAPLTALTRPERGGRFGIAIALVVLLILFTLALSIVLRPRRRDTPIELSRVHQVLETGPAALG